MNELEAKNTFREQVICAESEIKEMPQLDIPVTNHFSKDVYGREITIPADSIVVSKIHKHQSLNILAGGEIIMATESGVQRLKAPYVVVSPPGVKRMVYTVTECTWVTVHGTSETDVDKIEEQFIAKTYDDVEELEVDHKNFIEKIKRENLCLG